VDQTSGTIPTDAPAQGPQQSPPAETPAAEQPGFGSRGRIRRRARFLRRARELAYRDLGGLVFNLHRFGERNDSLVLAKLATLSHIDTELRTIESALGGRSPITVLREAGITACPRCAAIHGSEDRFCPNCGLPLARNVDLPIAAAVATPPPTPAASAPAAPAPAPPAEPAPVAAEPAPAPAPPSPAEPAREEPATAAFQSLSGTTASDPPGDPAPAAGRSPAPPARATTPPRAATPAGPPRPRRSEPGDSTEVLHPQAPGQ
jgi:hypothetical protein